MHIKNGESPAMPLDYQHHNTRGDYVKKSLSGLTKREKFAMAAMQGFLSSGVNWGVTHIAEASVSQADALLKQLEEIE